MRLILARVALPFALAGCMAALILPRAFWVMDEAFSYLQVEGLTRSFSLPPALPWPGSGQAGDAAEGLRPLPYHYGFVREGRLYAQYTPLLPLLSWLPSAGGRFFPGLFAVPVLGAALAAAVGVSRLKRNGFGLPAAAGLAILCTPLPFFSQTFWAHTPALALGAASAYASLGRRPWAAAALLVPAVLLREETLVALPLILLADRPRKSAPAFLAAVASILCLERLLTGSWLGTHVAASGTEQLLYGFYGGIAAEKAYVAVSSMFLCLRGCPLSLNLAAGGALWLAWAASRFRGRISTVAFAAGLAGSAFLLVRAAADGLGFFDVFWLKHPLLVFPVLWLVKPSRKLESVMPWLLLAAVLAVMSPMHAQDGAWGTRLIMLPLLLAGLTATPRGRRTIPVIALGALSTAVSIGYLAQKRSDSARLLEMVRGPAPIVCTTWLLPGEFALAQARGTPVFFAATGADLLAATRLTSFPASRIAVLEGSVGSASSLLEAGGLTVSGRGGVDLDPALRVFVLDAAAPGGR